ncbi:hypothetical protein MMPV_009856 [Pyropia vietnamensis]
MAATAACAARDERCFCREADWGCGAGGDRSDGRDHKCARGCPASAAGVRARNGGEGSGGGGDGVPSGDDSGGGGGGCGGEVAGGCFGTRLRRSLDVLGGALRLYGTGRLAIAFNGGKDATVILHLMRAAVANHRRVVATEEASLPSTAAAAAAAPPPPPTTTVVLGSGETLHGSGGATPSPLPPPPRPTASSPILSMYITDADAFDEVECFVRATAARYGIEAVDQAGGFKAGIEAFVRCRGVAAFVLGTRRDDPHGGRMEHFEPSSAGWPPFMRVNAILDWSYADVWRFLRHWRLPYAGIYDRGYTSLGGVSNTAANPKLRRPDGGYEPAYCLDDARDERAGRT